MADIYQKDGLSLYDNNGKTYYANTAQGQGEYIPKPATPAPAPTPAPTATVDPNYVPRYTEPEPTPVVAESEDAIIARKQKAAQAEIDNLNKYYDSLLADQRVVNEGRDRGTNAISVLTGLAGSTEANVSANQTTKLNQKDNEKIQNERAVAIGSIFSKIRESAVEEARQSRLEARQSAQDIQAFRAKQAEEGLTHLQNLAMGGVTAAGLMKTNPQAYADLKKQLGATTDEEMHGLFVKNIPKEEIESSEIIDGRLVVAWRNPITNKLRIENVDLGLPESETGWMQVADAGNYFLFGKIGPDGKWDGDMETTKKVNKGLTPDQEFDNDLAEKKYNLEEKQFKHDTYIDGENLKIDRAKAASGGGGGGGGGGGSASDPTKTNSIQNILAKVQELKTHPGKKMAVGKSSMFNFVPGTGAASFVDKLNTVKSLLTLPNLELLKGAMSDNDLKFIQSAGTSLATSNSEKDFNEELDAIIARFEAALTSPKSNNSKGDEKVSADDIDKFLNSF